MILSVIISLLGLLAMCTYYTNQNSDSIAIKKVYGAQVWKVVRSYSRAFLWSVVISIVIAIPVAVYFMQKYLEGYTDRIYMPYLLIVAAVVISFFFSLIVICGEMLDAASENPVDSLKDK